MSWQKAMAQTTRKFLEAIVSARLQHFRNETKARAKGGSLLGVQWYKMDDRELDRLTRDTDTAQRNEQEWRVTDKLGDCPLCSEPFSNLAVHLWFNHNFKDEYDLESGRVNCLVCNAKVSGALALARHAHKHSIEDYEKAAVLRHLGKING